MEYFAGGNVRDMCMLYQSTGESTIISIVSI